MHVISSEPYLYIIIIHVNKEQSKNKINKIYIDLDICMCTVTGRHFFLAPIFVYDNCNNCSECAHIRILFFYKIWGSTTNLPFNCPLKWRERKKKTNNLHRNHLISFINTNTKRGEPDRRLSVFSKHIHTHTVDVHDDDKTTEIEIQK